jgi:hypothetical protein
MTDPIVYNQASALDNNVKVPNRRTSSFAYLFRIKATAEGGATYTSPEFTLNAIYTCTTTISASTSPVVTAWQDFNLDGSTDPMFTFPKFVNSNPACPINSYTINPQLETPSWTL